MAGNLPNQNANRIFVVLLFNVHPGSARFVGTTTRRAELKIRDRRQEHRCDVFPSPSRSNTRCRGRDARDTRAGVFPDSEGRLTWGVQTRPGARGVARVPSGCSCLNVERADIFVVDRREGERWFLAGLLLRARRYDNRLWSLGEDEG